MLISYNELKKYVDFDLSVDELREELTLKGLEVVAVKFINPFKNGLVIGEIIKKEKHPNADRLFLTEVNYFSEGEEATRQIVCGAHNFKVGDRAILATIGTKLSSDFKITKSKIRGIESQGMLCSKSELGLEDKSEGIWVLAENVGIKDDLKLILGGTDYILDIDLTSNRSDCLSIYGVARELSACLNKKLAKDKLLSKIEFKGEKDNFVEIKSISACPLYSAVKVDGIEVKPSPDWLQTKLFKHGVRSINNIVDITNLILIEYGQPLHVFDRENVNEKIIVRSAQKNEEFITLDNKKLSLDNSDLIIADKEKPIALAGIIGGLNSGVNEKTKNIILEAAYFEPDGVRLTSKKYKIDSDAAYYFSRNIDASQTLNILDRALSLIIEVGGGKIETINVQNFIKTEPKLITLSFKQVKKILNYPIKNDEVCNFLIRLSFKIIHSNEEEITVEVPSFRKDINYSWDLIEEIARLIGYNQFTNTLPAIKNLNWDLGRDQENRVLNLLSGLGYHEIITYPFIENDFVEILKKENEKNVKDWLAPQNPILKDISLLRKDLVFGFLKTIKTNLDKNQKDFNKAFEIGRVFSEFEGKYLEEEKLAFGGWGKKEIVSWNNNLNFDFYDLKGDLEELFKTLGFNGINLKENFHYYLDESLTAEVFLGGKKIGFIGLIKETLLDYFGMGDKNIYYSEISLDLVYKTTPKKVVYRPPSVYPSVYRDLAILIDKNSSIGDLLKEIKNSSSLLVRVDLGNIYEGENLDKKKKSIIFHLEFASKNKTLSREEADNEVNKVVKTIKKKYDFELR